MNLKKPSLLPLYLANFFAVFNDNLLKNLICFISIYWIAKDNESIIIMLANVMLVLPYILFSPYAGFLSKKLMKQKIVVFLKFSEIFIMLIGLLGFMIENIVLVMLAMFLMGLESTIFSPAKYGLVRDIGGEEKSSIGVGTIEMTTFFGVLLGTFAAGYLSDVKNRTLWLAIAFITVALIGFFTALLIKAEETKPLTTKIIPINFITFIIRKYKWANRSILGLNEIVIGLSMFWLIASLIHMNLLVHCPFTLKLTNTQTGLIMALVAISIGLGSWLSGILAKNKVKMIFVPIGGLGLVLGILLIYLLNPNSILFTVLILAAAFMGGIFKTPLNAWMQVNVKGRKLADAIAYNNLLNFIFLLFSALIFGTIETLFNSRIVFLVVSLISLFMVLFLSFSIPEIKEKLKKVLNFL